MKKRIITLVCLTLIILSTPVLGAYNVDVKCDNDVCIEGDTATFVVTLTTDLSSTGLMTIDNITYTKISIKDKQYDTTIAREDIYLTMGREDMQQAVLTGVIPPPTKAHDLYFIPCFSYTMRYHYLGKYDLDSIDSCGQDTLTMKVYPLSEIECRTTGNCKEDESCVEFKCKKLLCEDNQEYNNHRCQDLNCQFFQNARNHNCETNYTLFGGGIVLIGAIAIAFTKNLHKSRNKK